MFVPYVHNGQGFGSDAATAIAGCHFDTGFQRPYFDEHGRRCVTINTGKYRKDPKSGLMVPVREQVRIKDLDIGNNVLNNTFLLKDEWIHLQSVIREAATSRLRAWTDLLAASPYGGFDAMGTLTLEYETMSQSMQAVTDMDGLTDGKNDLPIIGLRSMPLPFHHVDFFIPDRLLAASRNKGQSLNLRAARQAGRRLAERVEKVLIGIEPGIRFGPNPAVDTRYNGQSQVYGYLTHPDVIVKNDMHTPDGTNASAIIDDVLEMRELMYLNHYYGPFVIYTSTDYDNFLDRDYVLTGGNVATQTLRERLLDIENVSAVRRLDWLTGSTYPFHMIMVNMTDETAQAINGMDISTWQWEGKGGWRKNFMVGCIQNPLLTSNHYGVLGVVKGTTS